MQWNQRSATSATSSGGVVLCETFNILEGYPMKDLGFHSAQGMHYQIEAMRHAYVDRNSYLGDPDFVKNPLDRLLDKLAFAAGTDRVETLDAQMLAEDFLGARKVAEAMRLYDSGIDVAREAEVVGVNHQFAHVRTGRV